MKTGAAEGSLLSLQEELRILKEQLAESEGKRLDTERMLAFYRAAADAVPNPIFIKDHQLRFVFFNRAYREFFGLQDDSYIGKTVLDLEYIPDKDRRQFHTEDRESLEKQTVLQYETSFRIGQGDAAESLYWSKGFTVPEAGSRGLIGEIVDISHEKRLQRDLHRSMQALELLMEDTKAASKTDPLTKIYNRNVLAADITAVISDAEASGSPVCAILIDIDYFKQINDTFGHLCGDEVLKQFAALLTRTFRRSDIPIRYGGDEFIVIMPGAQLPQALNGAERLCGAVRRELLLPDGSSATISAGVAEQKAGDTLLTFISRADEALYAAKVGGRNRVAAARDDGSR